jgi:murein L,D-transpeptidase YafK
MELIQFVKSRIISKMVHKQIKYFIFKAIVIVIAIILYSCNNQAKPSDEKSNIGSIRYKKEINDTIDTIVKASDIKLDSIEALDKSKEKQPEYINSRIKKLSDRIVIKWCKEAGFQKLPDYILFRVFKHERQFEIWGRNGNEGKLKLIKIVEVCAIESEPGPKLKGWDFNTAEGFYTYNIYYTSPSWYMWIKLTNDEIKKSGQLDYGSCFKMFINYPNDLDRFNSLRIHGKHNNIGTICIHGNCVTACCVSFENELWIVVFAFGLLHNTDYGLPNVYMFPCRFEKTDVKKLFKERSNYNLKDTAVLYQFWNNIKEGYFKFEKELQPLKFTVDKNGYHFE